MGILGCWDGRTRAHGDAWDPSSLTFPFASPTSVRACSSLGRGFGTGSVVQGRVRSLTTSAAGACHGARPDGSEAFDPSASRVQQTGGITDAGGDRDQDGPR